MARKGDQDFLHRMNNFVSQTKLWDKCGLDYELIIVEWNPLPDRPKLKDAIAWPAGVRDRVRFIEVTEQIHSSLPRSNVIQLHEFTGKNVGIRRAKGVFILTTNIDILFSAKLTKFLASHTLSAQCFYRTNTYALDRPIVPLAASITEELEFCGKHITRIGLRGETLNFRGRPTGLGRLGLAIVRYRFSRFRRRKLNRIEDILHTNGAGDFMLMSRDSWRALRGYPETFVVNYHIDAFICAMAASSGLRQVILNGRAYHQYHEFHDYLHRAPSNPDVYALYLLWVKQARQMLERGKPIIFNTENWGLSQVDCMETHL